MKEMRPTTGRVVQALFNILGPLWGDSFLDLFSGSGQIALEAHKRGAASVCCVESERKRAAEITKRAPDDVKCLCMDVRRAVAKFVRSGESFNKVFADPPYELGWGRELPALIAEYESLVAAGGVFVFEHSDREAAADLPAGRWEREDRAYGGTVLSFYRKRSAEDD